MVKITLSHPSISLSFTGSSRCVTHSECFVSRVLLKPMIGPKSWAVCCLHGQTYRVNRARLAHGAHPVMSDLSWFLTVRQGVINSCGWLTDRHYNHHVFIFLVLIDPGGLIWNLGPLLRGTPYVPSSIRTNVDSCSTGIARAHTHTKAQSSSLDSKLPTPMTSSNASFIFTIVFPLGDHRVTALVTVDLTVSIPPTVPVRAPQSYSI